MRLIAAGWVMKPITFMLDEHLGNSGNPSRDGAFRSVTITASQDGKRGLRVATREGYVAPDDAAGCPMSPCGRR